MEEWEIRHGPDATCRTLREQGCERHFRTFRSQGERDHLEMLVLLARPCFTPSVVESQTVVFRHAEPERLEVRKREQHVLILERAGDDQEVVLHDIEFVQYRKVRIRDVRHREILLGRKKGIYVLSPRRFLLLLFPRLILAPEAGKHANEEPYPLVFYERQVRVYGHENACGERVLRGRKDLIPQRSLFHVFPFICHACCETFPRMI